MQACLNELEKDKPDYQKVTEHFSKLSRKEKANAAKMKELFQAILQLNKTNVNLTGAIIENNNIQKAYKKLSRKYHPDRNPGKEDEVNNIFAMIEEARKFLIQKNNDAYSSNLPLEEAYNTVINCYDGNETTVELEDAIRAFNKSFADKLLKRTRSSGEYESLVNTAAAEKDFDIETFILEFFEREAVEFLDESLLNFLKQYANANSKLPEQLVLLFKNHNRYYAYRFFKFLPTFAVSIPRETFSKTFDELLTYIDDNGVTVGILFGQVLANLSERLRDNYLPQLIQSAPEQDTQSKNPKENPFKIVPVEFEYIYFVEHLNRVEWLHEKDDLLQDILNIAHKNPIAARQLLADLEKVHQHFPDNDPVLHAVFETPEVDDRFLLMEVFAQIKHKQDDPKFINAVAKLFRDAPDERYFLYKALLVLQKLSEEDWTQEKLADEIQSQKNDDKPTVDKNKPILTDPRFRFYHEILLAKKREDIAKKIFAFNMIGESADIVPALITISLILLKATQFDITRNPDFAYLLNSDSLNKLNQIVDMLNIAPRQTQNNTSLKDFSVKKIWDNDNAEHLANNLTYLVSTPFASDSKCVEHFIKCATGLDTIRELLNHFKIMFKYSHCHIHFEDKIAIDIDTDFLISLVNELPDHISQNSTYLRGIIENTIKRAEKDAPISHPLNNSGVVRSLNLLMRHHGCGGGASSSQENNGRILFYPKLLMNLFTKHFEPEKLPQQNGYFNLARKISSFPMIELQTQMLAIEGVVEDSSPGDSESLIEKLETLLTIEGPKEKEEEEEQADTDSEEKKKNEPKKTTPEKKPEKKKVIKPTPPVKLDLQGFILPELFSVTGVDHDFIKNVLTSLAQTKIDQLKKELETAKTDSEKQRINNQITATKTLFKTALETQNNVKSIFESTKDPADRLKQLKQLEIDVIKECKNRNINTAIVFGVVAAALLIGTIVACVFTFGAFGVIAGAAFAGAAAVGGGALAGITATLGVATGATAVCSFYHYRQSSERQKTLDTLTPLLTATQ